MVKRALITGITGQDGAHLARLLLDKGYVVHGLRLYSATDDTERLGDLEGADAFHLHHGDLRDAGNLWRLLAETRPDEIYNLAGQSHVGVSFAVPDATLDLNAAGPLRLLDAMRGLGLTSARFYQASSSEMFGNAPAPQHEETPFAPCSPYGAAKLCAYWLVRTYRDAYGLHASNGILFNHESAERGAEFVTRKITRGVAAIEAGRLDVLRLGNLEARRDWGHARDYVDGMWRMLQQDQPGDYVLATGQARTVRDFAVAAFGCIGIDLRWRGQGLEETGVCRVTGRALVAVNPRFYRPAELHTLIGDASRARRALGWRPVTPFGDLVREMVEADRMALRGRDDDVHDLLAAE